MVFFLPFYISLSSELRTPVVTAKYPLAHICYPQYLFFNFSNSCCNFRLLFPFMYCTAFDAVSILAYAHDLDIWSHLLCLCNSLSILPLLFFGISLLCLHTIPDTDILYKTLYDTADRTRYARFSYIPCFIILKYSPKGEAFPHFPRHGNKRKSESINIFLYTQKKH